MRLVKLISKQLLVHVQTTIGFGFNLLLVLPENE